MEGKRIYRIQTSVSVNFPNWRESAGTEGGRQLAVKACHTVTFMEPKIALKWY